MSVIGGAWCESESGRILLMMMIISSSSLIYSKAHVVKDVNRVWKPQGFCLMISSGSDFNKWGCFNVEPLLKFTEENKNDTQTNSGRGFYLMCNI